MSIFKQKNFIISTFIFLIYELFSFFIFKFIELSFQGKQIESTDIIKIIGINLDIRTLAYILLSLCVLFIIYYWIFAIIEAKNKNFISSIFGLIYILIIFATTSGIMSEGIGGYTGFVMIPVMLLMPIILISWIVVLLKFKNKKIATDEN